ncbi:poly glycohydrolase [Ancylostoma caninum]|uniref:poly(ADP-ribose) glycohydrolase n=1 Tax=Ancylostoma caninum TaxID=29170 RepID=A0A368G713_ANCCA|nr:poly glycohydrolase [Ancylostoma caninum]
MSDVEDHTDSIIPPLALEVVLNGVTMPRIVKKRKGATSADANVEIEESPEDDGKKSRRRKTSKQTSLESFLSSSTNGERWKPVAKTPPSKKKVTVVKKKIAIDPQDTPRVGKTKPVVTEIPSGDESTADVQQERLKNSIKRAKRRSINHYFAKEFAPKPAKKSATQSSQKVPTPKRKSHKTPPSSHSSEQITPANEVEKTPNGNEDAIVVDEVISVVDEVDPASNTSNNGAQMKDLEVVLELHNTPAHRPKKRAKTSTPRSLQKYRSTTEIEMIAEYRPRTAHSTPRRKLSFQRSFSSLPCFADEEEFDFPTTPVIRRRRPNGESSIFDLGIFGAATERSVQKSTSAPATGCVRRLNLTEASSTAVPVEDEDSEGSEELDDSAMIVSAPAAVQATDDTTPTKELNRTSNSGDVAMESQDVIIVAEGLTSSQSTSIFAGSAGSSGDKKDVRRCSSSSSSDEDEIVVLQTVQRTPSKSQPLVELLYSPRKMELTNARRLETILSKAANHYENEPNLRELNSDKDYCAFNVATISQGSPPEPSPKTCADMDLSFGTPGFVRLPWSTANINNGFHQYVIIDRALRALVHDGAHCIEAVIVTLKECAPWIKSFDGLIGFMDGLSVAEEREALDIMAGIAKLAVNAKFIITAPLPLLTANRPGSVTLSQEQCACLLAHAFYCTFRRERHNYNRINFAGIFHGSNPLSHVKLRFILNYFSLVLKRMPTGCVSFRREVVEKEGLPNWEEDDTSIPLVAVASDGSIEDSYGCLQVDFANEYIGGGVLNFGAEEIRFLICPEMIVSCLLCEKMGPFEAIHIVGAQRYSDYTGYGETLEWVRLENYGFEPRDCFRRVICEVVAMDAKLFKPVARPVQYRPENIDRELNKAFTGFRSMQRPARPIATGNWGCGVFGGDKELKSLIQMIAAAKVGRDMIYYTFSNEQFERSMNEHYEKLVQKKATVGSIYKALISYRKERERNPRLKVFEHVYAFISESACTTS